MLNSDNVVEVVLSQCYVITMKYVDDNTISGLVCKGQES